MAGQRLRAALVALGLVAVAVVGAPATAGAATITACVNKSTGELRIRSGTAAKRKCPKGWKRLRWSTSGPAGNQGVPGAPGGQGIQGPAGPQFSVKDASGAVVGKYIGMFPQPFPIYVVERDGGFWYYLGSGQLYPFGSPNWKTVDCSGQAYLEASGSLSTATFTLLVGGPFRFAFRTLSAGVFGPTSGWKGRGTSETLPGATQLYERNSTTGACEADGLPVTGDLLPLDPVTAPPDFTGPLVIG